LKNEYTNTNKEIVWVRDYNPTNINRPRSINGQVIDDDGNLVLLLGAAQSPSIQQLGFQRIDVNTGEVLDEEIWDEEGFHFVFGMVNNGNGFTVREYWSEDLLEPDASRGFTGSLTFVNKDLKLIRRVNVTEPEIYFAAGMVQTRDGGYALSYFNGLSSLLLIRTDQDGKVLWRKEILNAVSNLGETLLETADGGIAIVFNQDFNEIGNRITLMKFDASGNLF